MHVLHIQGGLGFAAGFGAPKKGDDGLPKNGKRLDHDDDDEYYVYVRND